MNAKVKKEFQELLAEVFAKKSRKLPFKYKGFDVYEPLYDRLIIADFPRYILVDNEGAVLALDDDCIRINKIQYRKK